jgi:anthranilate phosphoribosyltransferase
MSDTLHHALKLILEARQTLTRPQARELLEAILEAPSVEAPANELRIAALLGALAARGETTDELAGFVDALRARTLPVPLTDVERAHCVDTCGTGGDLSGTFNISTASALVAAAAGATIAKHGNRAVTSRSGSADVLEALGIPVDLTPESAAAALRNHGFVFLAAPAYSPALKSVMPIRRALGVRTAFNILGPMLNPAQASAQVMGVYAPHLVPIAAETLAALSTRHAFVVHGFATANPDGPGMDEFSISGPTSIAEVRGSAVTYSVVLPEHFNLPAAPIESLAGGDALANAAILTAIFAGERGPRRDVVVMNAAAVLVTAALAPDFPSAAALAQRTIDSGAVTALVHSLGAP